CSRPSKTRCSGPNVVGCTACRITLTSRLTPKLRSLPSPRSCPKEASLGAIARGDILRKFQAMVAEKRPIIGGGAGTGLSAKSEEAGGIDLIIIYISGRYRMAGRGSSAGLLAYGNANEIVRDMAR